MQALFLASSPQRSQCQCGGVQALGLGSALTAHPHIDPPTADCSARLALWKWQR